MTEHTPTPWKVCRNDSSDLSIGTVEDDPWYIAEMCLGAGGASTQNDPAPANAAFICKAVNRDHHFDVLVKALQFIADGYERHDINHVDYRVKVYQVASEALASVGCVPQTTEEQP